MAHETFVQTIVHKLEEGGWKVWILRALVVAFLAMMIWLWMFSEGAFKGLSHERAMEQAEIAREIARGHGFSTKMIRPAALFQLKENKGIFDQDRIPDAYHGPLNPYINAPFMWLVKSHWTMSTKDIQYLPDRIIVFVQLAFMIAGWVVSYFTMRRLFDARLAAFGLWLMILCQTFWDFAISGLPQNLILFLFSCACYALVRAVENRVAVRPFAGWLIASSIFFGLMALTHALTLWVFAGAVIFALLYFPPYNAADETEGSRGFIRRTLVLPLKGLQAIASALRCPDWLQRAMLRPAPFVMLAVVALMYLPWMVRNQRACGDAFGLGWYTGLVGLRGSEGAIMRSMEPPFQRITPTFFRLKVQNNLSEQTNHLLEYLGGVVVAPVFFLALLHLFKREETGHFRWAVLSMWLMGTLGMAVFGLAGKPVGQPFAPPVDANDLHILFVPLFVAYGMAFVLVLWSRLNLNILIVRWAFLAVIFALSAQPFVRTFIDLWKPPTSRVQWPPYVPPFISILSQWTTEREVIASDMPWAVAWYADRKSLWMPMTVKDFVNLNDNQLNGRLIGLYLTPVSANKPFLSEIEKGDYKEWAPFITRQLSGPGLRDFPLHAVTPLPIDNECIFYADRDRWTPRED
jgi:hypothetical protein